jgi:hypothetical protein
MGREMRFLLIIVMAFCCSSCTVIWDQTVHVSHNTLEVVKTLWGSSTRALEHARDRAVTKTYDKPYWDCVRSAIHFVEKHWTIFKKDEVKGYMVIMGVKGCVNTTEVGVFFDELSDTQTRIEISSLSTNCKRFAAKRFFHGMDIAFGLAPPDKPEPGAESEKPENAASTNPKDLPNQQSIQDHIANQ